MGFALWVQEEIGGSDCVSANALHLGEDAIDKVEIGVSVISIEVFLEVLVADFIAFLEFPVVISVFLNGIVG